MVIYQKSLKESISKIAPSYEETNPVVKLLRFRRLTKPDDVGNIAHAERKKKLTKIKELGSEIITEVKDIDVLLEHILSKARQLIKADAGSIDICL